MGERNAETLAQRDRRYALEHDASRRRSRPLGFPAMLRDFVIIWEGEIATRIHASGVEWEPPGRIVREDGTGVTDPGGGNELGSPRFAGETRAFLFGRADRVDIDGNPTTAMHAAVERLSRQRRHQLKGAVLRMVGRGGGAAAIPVACPQCGAVAALPDEYAEAILRDALALAFRLYDEGYQGGSRLEGK